MNEAEAQSQLIARWLERADQAMASAELELGAGHTRFAVNRLYYACFYAVTALLLQEGKQFPRHSGLIGEFNRSFVKTGRVEAQAGKVLQGLFQDRQEADYMPTAEFSGQQVASRLVQARRFLDAIRSLIRPAG
jgi:hypothetical protein